MADYEYKGESAAQNDDLSHQEIDLKFVKSLLAENKIFIGVCIISFFLIGVLFASTRPDIYMSTALVKVEGDGPSTSNMVGLLGIAGQSQSMKMMVSPAEIESTLIRSEYILGDAIEKLGYNVIVNQERFPVIGNIYSSLFKNNDPLYFSRLFPKYSWGNDAVDVVKFVVPKYFEGQRYTIVPDGDSSYTLYDQEGVKVLQGRVGSEISQEVEDGTVYIKINSINSKPGVNFIIRKRPVDKTVRSFINNLDIREKGERTGILELSYRSTNSSVAQEILNEILVTTVRKNILEKAEEATKTLSFLQNQLPNVVDNLNQSESKLNHYQADNGAIDDKVQMQLLVQEIVNLENSSDQLSLKKMEMLENFSEKHPYVQAVNEKQKKIEEKIKIMRKKLREIPIVQQKTLNFQRDINVHGDIYSGVMQTMQQMEILKGSTVSSVKVLKSASYPVFPIARKTRIILIASIFAGVMFSFSIVLLRYLLRKTLDPSCLEKTLGVHVLAVIPYTRRQKNIAKSKDANVGVSEKILAIKDSSDLAVEAVRSLRTSLRLTNVGDTDCRIIGISGTSPGVGKSFISTNLATLFSDLNEKVLIIDADMRKGYLHKIFNIPKAPGLSDYLSGDLSIDQCTYSSLPNFDIIPSGRNPEKAADLLMSESFKLLIEKLKYKYDIIIVDTPPVLAVTDPVLILRYTNLNILVVGSGKENLREIAHGKGVFDKNNISLDGAVFNNLNTSSAKYGYGGYYNYYNYSYK